jgi:inositol 3-alpha-galactosyltransferase
VPPVATMRKRHNAIAATLLVLGMVYLCAQHDNGLPDPASFYALAGARGSNGVVNAHGHNVNDPNTTPHSTVASVSSESAPANGATEEDAFIDSSKQSHPQPDAEWQAEHGGLPAAQNLLPQDSKDETTSKLEYSFQNDLEVDIPVSILQQFSSSPPLNYDTDAPKPYAFATFMATRNPSLKDPYFLAIHSLIHRVLWSSQTRTQKNYPFIVFIAEFVTVEQRALLTGAGAIIRELAPLEWHCDAPGVQKRWNDLFAKLNMWAETDFERILFLDADAFPLANIDDMLDNAPEKECVEDKVGIDDFLADRSPVCENYVFAGVPQAPFSLDSPNINVGSMVFKPSVRMHQRLLQNYQKTDHYDCAMAEQAFLNWQFNPQGAFPPTGLGRQWGGFFPKEEEEGNLKIVHEKLWAVEQGWLRKEWERGWAEMSSWYASDQFVEARARGHT